MDTLCLALFSTRSVLDEADTLKFPRTSSPSFFYLIPHPSSLISFSLTWRLRGIVHMHAIWQQMFVKQTKLHRLQHGDAVTDMLSDVCFIAETVSMNRCFALCQTRHSFRKAVLVGSCSEKLNRPFVFCKMRHG